jgi:hypothetical protein
MGFPEALRLFPSSTLFGYSPFPKHSAAKPDQVTWTPFGQKFGGLPSPEELD